MLAGRKHEVTRVEGFSDAVFAFALTLLVVSLDVTLEQRLAQSSPSTPAVV